MSVTEILAELPKLDPAEMRLVLDRLLELSNEPIFRASPELLQAIAEADAAPEEQDIDISEARRIVKSWNTE